MFLSTAGRICLNILKDKKQVAAENEKKGITTEENKDDTNVDQGDVEAMKKVGGWNPALKLKAVSTPWLGERHKSMESSVDKTFHLLGARDYPSSVGCS